MQICGCYCRMFWSLTFSGHRDVCLISKLIIVPRPSTCCWRRVKFVIFIIIIINIIIIIRVCHVCSFSWAILSCTPHVADSCPTSFHAWLSWSRSRLISSNHRSSNVHSPSSATFDYELMSHLISSNVHSPSSATFDYELMTLSWSTSAILCISAYTIY